MSAIGEVTRAIGETIQSAVNNATDSGPDDIAMITKVALPIIAIVGAYFLFPEAVFATAAIALLVGAFVCFLGDPNRQSEPDAVPNETTTLHEIAASIHSFIVGSHVSEAGQGQTPVDEAVYHLDSDPEEIRRATAAFLTHRDELRLFQSIIYTDEQFAIASGLDPNPIYETARDVLGDPRQLISNSSESPAVRLLSIQRRQAFMRESIYAQESTVQRFRDAIAVYDAAPTYPIPPHFQFLNESVQQYDAYRAAAPAQQ